MRTLQWCSLMAALCVTSDTTNSGRLCSFCCHAYLSTASKHKHNFPQTVSELTSTKSPKQTHQRGQWSRCISRGFCCWLTTTDFIYILLGSLWVHKITRNKQERAVSTRIQTPIACWYHNYVLLHPHNQHLPSRRSAMAL